MPEAREVLRERKMDVRIIERVGEVAVRGPQDQRELEPHDDQDADDQGIPVPVKPKPGHETTVIGQDPDRPRPPRERLSLEPPTSARIADAKRKSKIAWRRN